MLFGHTHLALPRFSLILANSSATLWMSNGRVNPQATFSKTERLKSKLLCTRLCHQGKWGAGLSNSTVIVKGVFATSAFSSMSHQKKTSFSFCVSEGID